MQRTDPDEELVRQIAQGDQRAAAALMRLRLPRILALAQRMLGDRAAAEDVAQEVFLRVWRDAHRWKPGAAKFETWMCRVATNLCLDRLRRRREVDLEAAPEPTSLAQEGADMTQQRQMQARVRAAIGTLPERQRAALLLAHFEEMSNPDIAAILDISVEAVESLLARARRALRTELVGARHDLLGAVI
jgi:RNA polymerase sigma-70 factor (ECF subfamily)